MIYVAHNPDRGRALFRGKRQDRNARRAAEAQRDAEQAARIAALADRPDTVCPFLGMAAARADFSETPHEEHRCYAFGDAAALSKEQQARVCLQRGYGNCPRYLRGLLVIPTEEMEAIRRRKADFPTDVVRDAPRAPAVVAPAAAVVAAPPARPEPVVAPPPVVRQPDPQASPAAAAPTPAIAPTPEPAPEPTPVAASAVPEMPPPIRIARPPRRPQPSARGSRPAARRSRRWRTATLVMATAVLVLALASATGLFALSRLDDAAVAEPSSSPVVSPTRSTEPTATERPTPRATRTARPTRTPSPSPTAAPRTTPSPAPRPADETWTYVVEDNDSISSIAQRYGSTTEAVLDLNPQYRDNPNFVVEGDLVVVPCTTIAVREGRCS